MDDWLEIKCTCGNSRQPNVVHRTDGPCYHKDQQADNLTDTDLPVVSSSSSTSE